MIDGFASTLHFNYHNKQLSFISRDQLPSLKLFRAVYCRYHSVFFHFLNFVYSSRDFKVECKIMPQN